ncbi:hypothetical protein OROHE_017222 [Orobanche hederae]
MTKNRRRPKFSRVSFLATFDTDTVLPLKIVQKRTWKHNHKTRSWSWISTRDGTACGVSFSHWPNNPRELGASDAIT